MDPHHHTGWRAILDLAKPFEWAMRATGYHRAMRTLAQDHVRANNHSRILDIGCGTSLILDHLPPSVKYRGYDNHAAYIASSRRTFHHRTGCRFEVGDLDAVRSQVIPGEFDLVLAISILHHLSDSDAKKLFEVSRAALAEGGRLIAYDPLHAKDQHVCSRWMNRLDRGRQIRSGEGYLSLVPTGFRVRQILRRDLGSRVPGITHVLECEKVLA